jgi:hypothetical protein
MRASTAAESGPCVSRCVSCAAINFWFLLAGKTATSLPSENRTAALSSYIAVVLVQQDYRLFPT